MVQPPIIDMFSLIIKGFYENYYNSVPKEKSLQTEACQSSHVIFGTRGWSLLHFRQSVYEI